MKNQACPVSTEKVDKYLLKTYAVLVIFFLVFFLSGYKTIFYLITADFFIRVTFGIRYSPACYLIRKIYGLLSIHPKYINAGPKKFAAKVGLLFSVLISIATLTGFTAVANIIAGIFLLALLLEVIFDYCLACKMQSLYLSFIRKH